MVRPAPPEAELAGHAEPEIPLGDRGLIIINESLCKGCSLCVVHCPPEVLSLASGFNPFGYHPAAYTGEGCTGCAICFYVCPEPGAISVYRREGKEEKK
jgi:Pyruvate/2-oxoacid:ferredoxin oxidoreductase delta subunit